MLSLSLCLRLYSSPSLGISDQNVILRKLFPSWQVAVRQRRPLTSLTPISTVTSRFLAPPVCDVASPSSGRNIHCSCQLFILNPKRGVANLSRSEHILADCRWKELSGDSLTKQSN
jgi:hypothetical protein